MAAKRRYRHPTQEQVAIALATAPHWQPWRHEGHCRAIIRAVLCLQGCSWNKADAIGRRLVARARSLVLGLPAPRGWDYNVYDSFEDDRECWVCDRRFVARNEAHRFCSIKCTMFYRRRDGAVLPVHARCARCNEVLVDRRPGTKYCSKICASRAGNARFRQRHRPPERDEIAYCAAPGCTRQLPEDRGPKMLYCSGACTRRPTKHGSMETAVRPI